MKSRAARPMSSGTDFESEHDRDDPGLARQTSRLTGRHPRPVVQQRGRVLAQQLLDRHRDHDGGVHPCGLRGRVHRVALDVLDQRLSETPTQRLPLARLLAELVLGVAGRVGQRQQVPLQHRADVRRHDEPAVAAALAVVGHGEVGLRRGTPLLRLQHGSLMTLAHLGGDHVEDPLADLPQLTRIVLTSKLEEHALGLLAGLEVDVRREGVDRFSDHPRLLRPHRARRQRRRDPRVLLQRPPERQVAARLAPRRPGLDRQPRRRVPQPVGIGHVIGGAQDPREQRIQLRTRPPSSPTSADCFSSTDMKAGSTDATPFSAAPRSSAHSMIGCTGHLLARTSRTPTRSGWGGEACWPMRHGRHPRAAPTASRQHQDGFYG